jgi:hypothetical protein
MTGRRSPDHGGQRVGRAPRCGSQQVGQGGLVAEDGGDRVRGGDRVPGGGRAHVAGDPGQPGRAVGVQGLLEGRAEPVRRTDHLDDGARHDDAALVVPVDESLQVQ